MDNRFPRVTASRVVPVQVYKHHPTVFPRTRLFAAGAGRFRGAKHYYLSSFYRFASRQVQGMNKGVHRTDPLLVPGQASESG